MRLCVLLSVRVLSVHLSVRLCVAIYFDPVSTVVSKEGKKTKELSLTAHRLDTGANWRVLVLSPAHHRSLSDSVKNGNSLSTVHNAAVPAR